MAALRHFLRAQSFFWRAVSRRRATRPPKQRDEQEASARATERTSRTRASLAPSSTERNLRWERDSGRELRGWDRIALHTG